MAAQQKQIGELQNSIRYLEGLLDTAKVYQQEAEKVDNLHNLISQLKAEIADKSQQVSSLEEKCDDYKAQLADMAEEQ